MAHERTGAGLVALATRAGLLAVATGLALAAPGCARPSGPPTIRLGTVCDGCGMEVQDLRFACERRAGKDWRVYDSIECLMRDGGPAATLEAWLPDYDAMALHAADSMWVAHGPFPSPMGGGYASFLSRAAADSLVATTGGTVARLAEQLAGVGGTR
jgi:nitrous oxide reductase accessory protein NosL